MRSLIFFEGVSRHSETGVMKARWDVNDFEHMAGKPLPFSPEDIILIGRGLEARESRLALAATVSRSKARTL